MPTAVIASAGMPSPSPPQQQEPKEVQPKIELLQQQNARKSSSEIVHVPVPFPMFTGPVGFLRSRKKFSVPSWQVSLIVETLTTFEVSPGWNCNWTGLNTAPL